MYLAAVIDCYSRSLVGFTIADHMRTSLVQDALLMAKGQRGNLKVRFFTRTTAACTPPMRSKGTCTELGIKQSMVRSAPVLTTR